MIKIITKENQSILFNETEIKFSNFLNNMFFNKNFYNYEDSDNEVFDNEVFDNEVFDNEVFDNEVKTNNSDIKELKINKISINALVKIKGIIQYVLKNNINIEENINDSIEIQRFIKISPLFPLKEFFKLLDSVNYLHIEFIIKLMVNYLKKEIEENHILDIIKKFDLNEEDFTDNEHLRKNLLNEIINND
jgi:hypothetical protein